MENEKNYNARVEISMIVKMSDIRASGEDNAVKIAERFAKRIASRLSCETNEFEGCSVSNCEARCTELEDALQE